MIDTGVADLIFAPSDKVVQGHFQVVSVILAPSKSNLSAFLIAVFSLRGGMAPSGLLLRSATGCRHIVPSPNSSYIQKPHSIRVNQHKSHIDL